MESATSRRGRCTSSPADPGSLLGERPVSSVPADDAVHIGLNADYSRRVGVGVEGGEQQNLWQLVVEDLCHLAEGCLAVGLVEGIGAVDQLIHGRVDPASDVPTVIGLCRGGVIVLVQEVGGIIAGVA